jgi:hypothetical protein
MKVKKIIVKAFDTQVTEGYDPTSRSVFLYLSKTRKEAVDRAVELVRAGFQNIKVYATVEPEPMVHSKRGN